MNHRPPRQMASTHRQWIASTWPPPPTRGLHRTPGCRATVWKNSLSYVFRTIWSDKWRGSSPSPEAAEEGKGSSSSLSLQQQPLQAVVTSSCNLRLLTKTLRSNCCETPPAASSYSSVICAPVPAGHVKLLHGGLGGGCVVTDFAKDRVTLIAIRVRVPGVLRAGRVLGRR